MCFISDMLIFLRNVVFWYLVEVNNFRRLFYLQYQFEEAFYTR